MNVQFSADKGLEGNRIYDLIGEHAMMPIIDNHTLWSQEKKDGNYDLDNPILRMLNDGKKATTCVRGRAVFLTSQRPLHAGSSLRSRAVEDEN